jgi:hypothetical protein
MFTRLYRLLEDLYKILPVEKKNAFAFERKRQLRRSCYHLLSGYFLSGYFRVTGTYYRVLYLAVSSGAVN